MADPTTKTLSVTHFLGMNTQASRQSIKDGQFSWLEGVMPVGDGNLEVLPSIGSTLVTMSGQTIVSAYPAVIGTTSYLFAFTSTGALYVTPVGGVMAFVKIAGPGTFSTSGVSAAVWKNESLVIIDPVYGYFIATQTTVTGYKGTIASAAVTFAGNNYTSSPSVSPASGAATFSSTIGPTLATVSVTGTGYAVGDVLTVVGGTFTTAATLTVSSVSSGAISGFNISTQGAYTIAPANPVSVTGGHGSGATFTLNFGLVAVAVVAAGSGYASAPSLTVSGGGGTGATATCALSVSAVGDAISVFDDRVWIANARTIVFSSADSNTNFDPTTGAGSFILTDGQFRGTITALFSAAGYMYIIGDTAVSIVSNVQVTGTPPVTTMSITPITSVIGTDMPFAIISYMRSVIIAADFGVYGITGSSTQKISDDLDGVFANTAFTQPASMAVGIINNQLCVALLLLYAPVGTTPRSKVFIFMAGKWFVADAVGTTQIFASVINDAAVIMGTNGTTVYELFSGVSPISVLIQTKLYSAGAPMAMKETQLCGIETRNDNHSTQAVSFSIDTEYTSGGVPAANVAYGYGLTYADNAQYGKSIGVTITGTVSNMRFLGVHMQYTMRAEWLAVLAQAQASCTAQGSSAIPGYAIPGCMIAGKVYP